MSKQERYDKVYMEMAKVISRLSYAKRNKVGCIIVSKNGQIISQGWNGTPSGADNECEYVKCNCEWRHGCQKTGEPIEKMLNEDFCYDCKFCQLSTKPEVLHAESNAISKCAKWISSTEGATLYVTLSPCIECAKLIIQSGIKRVCYQEKYRDTYGINFLQKQGIIVEQIEI